MPCRGCAYARPAVHCRGYLNASCLHVPGPPPESMSSSPRRWLPEGRMAGSGLGTRRIASLGPCSWTPTPCALVAVSPGPEPVFVATTVAWALPKVPLIAVAAYPHRHYPVVSTSVGRDLDVGGVAGSTRSHTQAEYADRMSGGRGTPDHMPIGPRLSCICWEPWSLCSNPCCSPQETACDRLVTPSLR